MFSFCSILLLLLPFFFIHQIFLSTCSDLRSASVLSDPITGGRLWVQVWCSIHSNHIPLVFITTSPDRHLVKSAHALHEHAVCLSVCLSDGRCHCELTDSELNAVIGSHRASVDLRSDRVCKRSNSTRLSRTETKWPTVFLLVTDVSVGDLYPPAVCG